MLVCFVWISSFCTIVDFAASHDARPLYFLCGVVPMAFCCQEHEAFDGEVVIEQLLSSLSLPLQLSLQLYGTGFSQLSNMGQCLHLQRP